MKSKIQVSIYNEDEMGNIIEVINAHGLHIKWLKGKRDFYIPRYFKSDGCSVPQFLWDFLSPPVNPQTLRASLAHDYIYRTQPDGWTKEEADLMFYDLMVEDGFPKWKAWLAYKGVSWFGGKAWETKGAC